MASHLEPGWYLVARAALPEFLPRVKALAEKAFEYDPGKWTWEQLQASLLSGERVLWIAYRDGVESAMCAEMVRYPTGNVGCSIFIASGRNSRYWSGEPFKRVVEWAKDCGASWIEGIGRGGWQRVIDDKWGKRIYMRRAV